MPKYRIPEKEHDPRHAYQVVHDELMMDGNARQNLATFCQTWLDPEIHKLMDECIDKNMIDKDEYPQSAEIESRCVHMLADLWNAPDATNTLGVTFTCQYEPVQAISDALDQLSEYHRNWVEGVLKNGSNQRDAKWTEAIAVGDKEFVMETKAKLDAKAIGRRELENNEGYELKEPQSPYNRVFDPERGSLRPKSDHIWQVS